MTLRMASERTDTQHHATEKQEELMRRLVACVEGETQGEPLKVLRRTEQIVDEIMLEIAIDDTQYCLVRSKMLATSRTNLSPRELAIARLIAKGLPNKCIGDILEISPWTVATHLRRIFHKLDVTSRAAMVARLSEENML